MEWSDDQILLFIAEVEKHPVLWDTTNACYKIVRRKNDAWESLGTMFKTTGEEVKKKWQSLQASFRREKVKEKSQSGMEASQRYVSKWFAYHQMSFISDRYKPRPTTNTSENFEPLQDSESDYNEDKEERGKDETPLPDVNELPTTPVKKRKMKKFLSPKAPQKKVCKDDDRIDEVYKIMKTVATENSQNDENAIYGEYVASTLKKLDDYSKVIAKHQINQILYEAELGRFKISMPQSSPAQSVYDADLSSPSTSENSVNNFFSTYQPL